MADILHFLRHLPRGRSDRRLLGQVVAHETKARAKILQECVRRISDVDSLPVFHRAGIRLQHLPTPSQTDKSAEKLLEQRLANLALSMGVQRARDTTDITVTRMEAAWELHLKSHQDLAQKYQMLRDRMQEYASFLGITLPVDSDVTMVDDVIMGKLRGCQTKVNDLQVSLQEKDAQILEKTRTLKTLADSLGNGGGGRDESEMLSGIQGEWKASRDRLHHLETALLKEQEKNQSSEETLHGLAAFMGIQRASSSAADVVAEMMGEWRETRREISALKKALSEERELKQLAELELKSQEREAQAVTSSISTQTCDLGLMLPPSLKVKAHRDETHDMASPKSTPTFDLDLILSPSPAIKANVNETQDMTSPKATPTFDFDAMTALSPEIKTHEDETQPMTSPKSTPTFDFDTITALSPDIKTHEVETQPMTSPKLTPTFDFDAMTALSPDIKTHEDETQPMVSPKSSPTFDFDAMTTISPDIKTHEDETQPMVSTKSSPTFDFDAMTALSPDIKSHEDETQLMVSPKPTSTFDLNLMTALSDNIMANIGDIEAMLATPPWREEPLQDPSSFTTQTVPKGSWVSAQIETEGPPVSEQVPTGDHLNLSVSRDRERLARDEQAARIKQPTSQQREVSASIPRPSCQGANGVVGSIKSVGEPTASETTDYATANQPQHSDDNLPCLTTQTVASMSDLIGWDEDGSRELGSGVSGTVYLHRHAKTKCPVALKVLDLPIGFFRDEIRIQKALGDLPWFPALYGTVRVIGCRTGLAMEFMGSETNGTSYTISDCLENTGPCLSRDEWFHVIGDVALGLQAIHARGFLYNDVKEDNILVVREEEAGLWRGKMVDFGCASDISDPWEVPVDDEITKAYLEGEDYGHMAPECVLAGEPCSTSSDVFALGRLLKVIGEEMQFPDLQSYGLAVSKTGQDERPTLLQVMEEILRMRFAGDQGCNGDSSSC